MAKSVVLANIFLLSSILRSAHAGAQTSPVEEKAHLCQYYTQLLVNQSNMHMDNLTHMLKVPSIRAIHHKCKHKNMNTATTDLCTLPGLTPPTRHAERG